jgi:peptidoglycan/LPS O-acetylase OafA/YrhL
MTKRNGNVAYLDGVRGIAAFLVFLHHFCLVFYTAYFTWDATVTHLHGADIKYGQSIFSFITNGNYCVQIFFVLSGFVLSRRYLISQDLEIVISGLHRRFLRLFIPVAFALILSYVMIKAHLFYNVPVSQITHSEWWFGNMWRLEEPFMKLISNLSWSTMFSSDSTLDTTLWTLTIEFYGSLFVFAFLAFTHFTKFRKLFLLLTIYYFFMTGSGYYISFSLGISLYYIEQWANRNRKAYIEILAFLLLGFALFLGSFPSGGTSVGSVFEHQGHSLNSYVGWYHPLGAFLLVIAFILSPLLQRLVNFRMFRFLGYISFSLYLLHPLLMGSWSSWLFMKLLYARVGYNHAVVIVFLATTAILLPISWLIAKYIDQFGIHFAKRVYQYVRKPTGVTGK